MDFKIKNDDILEFLKLGSGLLGGLAFEIYSDNLNQVGKIAF